MSKFNRTQFMTLINKIIEQSKSQANIDKALKDSGKNLREDGLWYAADSIALLTNFYLSDVCHLLDKMYDTDGFIEDSIDKILFDEEARMITSLEIWETLEKEYNVN